MPERTEVHDAGPVGSRDSEGQLSRFCRAGRLAGTRANIEAAAFLKEALESEGYDAHILVDRSFARVPAAWGLGFLAFTIASRLLTGQHSPLIAGALLLGPLLKAAMSIHQGTPLAVFGVRRAKAAEGETPSPAVILGAHFDTVSLPFQGSFLAASLVAVILMAGVLAVAELISPWLAMVIAGAAGFFLYGNASPGGDDNASGVFAVLECAKRLRSAENVNVVPVFFNFEEMGLFGSLAFTRRFLGKLGSGIPGTNLDPGRAFMVNFDCVGRGKRIYISGDKGLCEMILNTSAAKALGVSKTWSYPSDHLMFRRPWKAVSFARADRYWMLDLSWIYSAADVPEKVNLDYVREVADIALELVGSITKM